jgi:tripartite-type tricarboxylate transporter receptor subunit TctC
MRSIRRVFGSGFVGAILFVLASVAAAQQFTGQTVTIVVNFPAGGPSDIEARVMARHLPKYVQGAAGVIVRNVGGGGGNIGVNQLGEASGRDRLNLGFFTWNPLNQVIGDESLRVRYNDFKLIAGMRQTTLVYARRDTAPGIGKAADVAKARPFRAGGMGPAGHSTVRQRLALDLLGARYETIHGYKGLREIDTAMLQGDIQVSSNSLPGYFTSAKPNLVDKGIAIPLLQYDRADGLPGRSPDLPDVPTFLEVYREVFGPDAAPSGEKWQALQLLTRILDSMYRSVFMPPSAPAPAVEEMRSAFEKLARDPEFIAEYEKVVKFKPRFTAGAEGERVVAELGNMQPAMVEFFRKYVDAGR